MELPEFQMLHSLNSSNKGHPYILTSATLTSHHSFNLPMKNQQILQQYQ